MPFLSELVGQVFEELARRMTSDQPPGLPTGIPALDDAIGGGWERQQLSYLVGDSGIGKSWLATSWILRGAQYLMANPDKRPMSGYVLTGDAMKDMTRLAVADKENKPPIIVFWSLEMSESPVVTRLLTQLAMEVLHLQLDAGALMRGSLGYPVGTPEFEERQAQCRELYALLHNDYGKHIYMEFEAHSVSEFRAVLDELVLAYDVVLVVVDYFRLIDEVSLDGGMVTEQASKSQKLRSLAKEYDCHVMSIFDINREGQKATKVSTFHMRGGVAANYDADLVLTADTSDDSKEVAKYGYKNTSPLTHLVLKVQKGRHVSKSNLDLQVNLASGYVELWEQRSQSIHNVDTHSWDEVADGKEVENGEESVRGRPDTGGHSKYRSNTRG